MALTINKCGCAVASTFFWRESFQVITHPILVRIPDREALCQLLFITPFWQKQDTRIFSISGSTRQRLKAPSLLVVFYISAASQHGPNLPPTSQTRDTKTSTSHRLNVSSIFPHDQLGPGLKSRTRSHRLLERTECTKDTEVHSCPDFNVYKSYFTEVLYVQCAY